MERTETILVVTCAWCGKPLGTKPGHGISGESSGMCQDCAERMLAQHARAKRQEDHRE